jgi:hypothetical protein
MASQKTKVAAVWGLQKIPDGERLTLWGVEFTSDGEQLIATLNSEDAAAIIDAGRAKKVQ